MTRHLLLQATMGSHAYGLALPESDVDTLGVFAYGTRDLWSLTSPQESVVTTGPDVTHHEVAKFMRLALGCNPTILELLWVDPRWVTEETEWGYALRGIREAFLSRGKVRDAFGGYALQQMRRLEREVRGTSRPEKRSKHLRHCFRLLRQGRELLESGTMLVTVPNPDDYWAFDNVSVTKAAEWFASEDTKFQEAADASKLPETPNVTCAEALLRLIREAHL